MIAQESVIPLAVTADEPILYGRGALREGSHKKIHILFLFFLPLTFKSVAVIGGEPSGVSYTPPTHSRTLHPVEACNGVSFPAPPWSHNFTTKKGSKRRACRLPRAPLLYCRSGSASAASFLGPLRGLSLCDYYHTEEDHRHPGPVTLEQCANYVREGEILSYTKNSLGHSRIWCSGVLIDQPSLKV